MYRDFFGLYRELYERLARRSAVANLIAHHSGVLRTVLARSENLR